MGKQSILLVEDEPSVADNIVYALSTEGYDPVHRSTGREALDALEGGEISLVVLDLGLPDTGGFDLLREIRKRWAVPVIIETSRSDEVDRIVGLELGADDYVVKPVSPRELTARVRAVLRRTAGGGTRGDGPGRPAPEAATRGRTPFEVDEGRVLIRYHGVPLDLSRYEYRLLCVLVKEPGRVYSREQLLGRISGEPEMSLDRTIDTHVKTLRQKLKAVREDENPIVTHRGIGYSLRESW